MFSDRSWASSMISVSYWSKNRSCCDSASSTPSVITLTSVLAPVVSVKRILKPTFWPTDVPSSSATRRGDRAGRDPPRLRVADHAGRRRGRSPGRFWGAASICRCPSRRRRRRPDARESPRRFPRGAPPPAAIRHSPAAARALCRASRRAIRLVQLLAAAFPAAHPAAGPPPPPSAPRGAGSAAEAGRPASPWRCGIRVRGRKDIRIELTQRRNQWRRDRMTSIRCT